MSNEKQLTCTIDAEDSKRINIGNIFSDADRVLKLRKVEDLETGDIYHFTKSEKEVNQIFDVIKNIVETCKVDPEVERKTLELSQSVKSSYLSKDPISFKSNYLLFTGFLANHTALADFIMPIIKSLFG